MTASGNNYLFDVGAASLYDHWSYSNGREFCFPQDGGDLVVPLIMFTRPCMGLNSVQRQSSASAQAYVNGILICSNNLSPVATLTSEHLFLMAQNVGGSPAAYCPYTVGAFCCEDGSANVAALAADIGTLQRALGRSQGSNPQNVILVVGQSLADGTYGPVPTNYGYSTVYGSVFNNLGPGGDFTSWLPSVQGYINFRSGRCKLAENQVSMGWKSMADQLASQSRTNGQGGANDALVIDYAIGATAYSGLSSDSTTYYTQTSAIPYSAGITTNRYWLSIYDFTNQLAVEKALTGNPIQCEAICSVHGETDYANNNYFYGTNMMTWQSNYSANLKTVTGQSLNPVMFHSQHSAFDPSKQESCTDTNMLMLQECYPMNHCLVGPKYQYFYSPSGGSYLHLTNYETMGEMYGHAIQHYRQFGWSEPVRPVSLVRSAAVITVTFTNTSATDLTYDDSVISDPGNWGFVVQPNGSNLGTASALTISSVAIATGAGSSWKNQVQITLAADPGAPVLVTYASREGVSGNGNGGPLQGPRGNLRDNDQTVGFTTGNPLYNWCVHFEKWTAN